MKKKKWHQKDVVHISLDVEVVNDINIIRCERILAGENRCGLSTIVNEILREYLGHEEECEK